MKMINLAKTSIALTWLAIASASAQVQGPEPAGTQTFHVLSPTTLELRWISDWPESRQDTWRAALTEWLSTKAYSVTCEGKPRAIHAVGVKRIPSFAHGQHWDLRVATSIFLVLDEALPADGRVQVTTSLRDVPKHWESPLSPDSENPALHVSQTGYQIGFPKSIFAGYYIGTLGELRLPSKMFFLVDAKTGAVVFRGQLKARPDHGWTDNPYQQVFEAEFDAFDQPGVYRLMIPGMGKSLPFRVGTEPAALLARSYALGLLEQRCGTGLNLPVTRFSHDPCHTKPAIVPTTGGISTEMAQILKAFANEAKRGGTNIIEKMEDILYPYDRQGVVDVAGGHHDAGDYSKYTSSAAIMAHYLIFAVDAFPGVSQLDNLGIPESGDGISDLLQEGKIEADYLLKLQDTDGGFYSIVYPLSCRYEANVLPEDGDTQVVYPKTTTATAAAVALLAQAASSPALKAAYPQAAARYRTAALKGWEFLERAFKVHGISGAYQQIGQVGATFRDADYVAWALTELYIATREGRFHTLLRERYTPGANGTIHWGWQRVGGGYGCAMRSYAFAARAGKLPESELDPVFLNLCRKELTRWGRDLAGYAKDSAYGTSFPEPTKRMRSAGWYFSSGQAFDIAVARELDATIGWGAVMSNLGYESGCNPVNQCFITGLGYRRETMVVNQYAENHGRQLPPSGLPVGNIVGGFQYTGPYKGLVSKLCYPELYTGSTPYPIYDRFVDYFDTKTEQVGADQSRALAVSALIMAHSPTARQAWRPTPGQVRVVPEGGGFACSLVSSVDLSEAVPVWESFENPLGTEKKYHHRVRRTGDQWIETEFLLPDGRRVFAATNFPSEFCKGTGLPKVSVMVEKPRATPQGFGAVRFARTGPLQSELEVGFRLKGGASNGLDVNWIAGSHYSDHGTITIKANCDHADLPIQLKPNNKHRLPRKLVIQIEPGAYNVAYPGSAEVLITGME